MKRLNYQHLYYFWRVATEESTLAASRTLGVSQSTISAQVSELEKALGKPLFERHGRRLFPTEFGRTILGYAEAIFRLGQELTEVAEGRPSADWNRISVGIVDVLPKNLSYQILAPLVQPGRRFTCGEGTLDQLLLGLSARTYDCLLSDAPLPASQPHRVFHHALGSTGVSFLAQKGLVQCGNFPHCLENFPILLSLQYTHLRRNLEQWFHTHNLQPQVAGEFEDTALMKEFASAGVGIMPLLSVAEGAALKSHSLEVIGRTEDIQEQLFLITPDRKLVHPAIPAILASAKALFTQLSKSI